VLSKAERESVTEQSPRRHPVSYSGSGKNLVPNSQEEEMEDLKKAIQASLKESRDHLVSKGRLEDESAKSATPSSVKTPITPQEAQPPKAEDLLIDFLSEPTPSTTVPTSVQQNAMVLLDATPQQHQVDPFGYNTGPAYNAPAVDEFAPKAPTYNDISDQILLNYSTQQNHATVHVPAVGQNQQLQSQDQSVASNPFDDLSQNFSALTSDTSQQNTFALNSAPAQQYQHQNGQQMHYQQQNFGYNNQM